MTVRIHVEHEDATYSGEVMTIRSTTLGWKDHGILTATLNCEGDGTGVGVGGYCLDTPANRATGDYSRAGTAYGLDHLMRIMETVGVSTWEKLPGQRVIVLHKSEQHWGQTPVGIANLITGKALLFKQHADAWRDVEVSS